MGQAKLIRRPMALVACGLLAVGLAACGTSAVPQDADLVAGKRMFVQRCGSCHVLDRANTSGTTGPDLDAAFRQSLEDGFGRGALRGVVRHQIAFPAKVPPDDANVYMPANLVRGDDARNVAAYVAAVAARPGDDKGLLATAVKQAGEGKPAVAQGGLLKIPADPNGQLTYVTDQARADAGKLETIQSTNASSVPHNIAVEGAGVRKVGEVVKDGGVSRIKVDLKPGTYTYFCTVQGHREAGMVGKLTVR